MYIVKLVFLSSHLHTYVLAFSGIFSFDLALSISLAYSTNNFVKVFRLAQDLQAIPACAFYRHISNLYRLVTIYTHYTFSGALRFTKTFTIVGHCIAVFNVFIF